MYYCIVILTSVAMVHFVYESIIAPSLRLELRRELFELSGELRLLHGDSVTRELQDSIHSLTCMLFRFDLLTIYAISQGVDRDADLKLRVEARSRILDAAGSPEVRAIRGKQIWIATKALAVNSGPMLVWLAVPALLFVGYTAVHRQVKNSLTVPGRDLRRFLPKQDQTKVGLPV
jgi:hypothetical protein